MTTQSSVSFNGQIAFVDAGVSDSALLVSQFQPGTEVHLLDASQAGIDQITEILSSRSDISAVHLVSHGSSGALQLGGDTISNLSESETALKLWSSSLTADADILLYGCSVVANAAGEAFVNSLAQLTGADVAASDDLTGLGGDWTLEYQTGTIETAAIAGTAYQGTLANFRVTTLDDVVDPNDGVISLREAVNTANILGGSNNIFFNVNGTITLGGSELTISNNLSIFGNGASFTTISGNNASRVFDVSSGTVLLSGLTIANGRASGNDSGGGIRNSGTLTVQFCTISGNSASSGGGGIFNFGTLNATGSTFTGNSAVVGGGILNNGTLNATSSTFTDNSADAGGGIFNFGTLNATGSTFTGNSADAGGGIYNNTNGTLNAAGSTFTGNSAGVGGGGILNNGTLNATNSTFTGNSATGVGGGICNSRGEAVINLCSFLNNQASDDGGGLYDERGTLSLLNSTFQGNRASAEGGGLYLTGSNAKVSASTFLSNSASNGGAIGLGTSSGTSTLLVTDSVLRFNSATTSGGGIFAGAGDSVTIRRSRVRQNTAPTGVDLFGSYISGGFNLIGKGGGFSGINNGVNGDVILVP